MNRTIEIPELLFHRLQRLATPLVDTPASIIERLLDHYNAPHDEHQKKIVVQTNVSYNQTTNEINRIPRERGIKIKINDDIIEAVSVADLYLQVLKLLCREHYIEKLTPYLPVATSRKRYLIATSPVHPRGNDFVVPVEYNGYYMEAHKAYKCGFNQLRTMLNKRCGLSVTYLE